MLNGLGSGLLKDLLKSRIKNMVNNFAPLAQQINKRTILPMQETELSQALAQNCGMNSHKN